MAGAIYVFCAAPIITNNLFEDNRALCDGGAIYAECSQGLTLEDNVFRYNVSGENWTSGFGTGRGGAIAVKSGRQTRITDNVFDQNWTSGGDGGGAVSTSGTDATISGNTFTGNVAHSSGAKGGALLVFYDDEPNRIGRTVIDHNIFGGSEPGEGNAVASGTPAAGKSGGAVCVGLSWLYAQEVEITANTFTSNYAPDFGGALSLEGFTPWTVILTATVVNNLFVGNHAGGVGGGAVCALDVSPEIVNNTFVENEATNSSSQATGHGGGILFWADSSAVTGLSLNNLFCENKAKNYTLQTSHGNSVECYGPSLYTAQADIEFCDSFSALYYNTDVYHYYLPNGPALGAGNEHGDPLFVNPTSDWQLQLPGQNQWSPIDKGHDLDDSPYDKVPTTDRYGQPGSRPVDIDDQTVPDGTGGTTDMGCYEKQQ
jgi:predicted outer membrane repeat protein